nr:hypothetical protein [Tanacetum cinerariifolium]
MRPSNRSEADVIEELAALTARPGYVHAMAAICYRDNMVSIQGAHTASDLSHMFDSQRLNRNEITTLLGLMMRQSLDLTELDHETLMTYVHRTDGLMRELHDSMTGVAMGELISQAKRGDDLENFWQGAMMKEPIFYGTESAYSFQYRDFFVEKHASDDDWLMRVKGFSSSQARSVASSMCGLMDLRATKD